LSANPFGLSGGPGIGSPRLHETVTLRPARSRASSSLTSSGSHPQPKGFSMKKLLLAISLFALTASAATADPIADRKALMKANGKAVGQLAAIAKGEQPFDAAVVQAALQTLNDDAQKLDVATLFPPGSDAGDTTASPKIWEDMAGFQAGVDKFKADAAAALAATASKRRSAPSVPIAAPATRRSASRRADREPNADPRQAGDRRDCRGRRRGRGRMGAVRAATA
jgi:cytochrome c556